MRKAPLQRVPLGTLRIPSRAKAYVAQVLRDGRLTYGRFAQSFERRFAELHRVREAVVTSSGTCALEVALAALRMKDRWRDGDEVIVPATTFVATVNTVLHQRLKPVFVDVDPTYFEMTAEQVAAKVTRRTRAVIPVHLMGQPCAMDEIGRVARRHNLRVIEDSCECMAVKYKDRPCGSWGDIACFSTYAAHLLSTGVGGIAVTQDRSLARLIRSLCNHGRNPIYFSIDDDNNLRSRRFARIVRSRFQFLYPGYSYRLTEMEWAIGLALLETDLVDSIRRRQRNASILKRALADLEDELQLPSVRPESEHAFMFFPLVLRRRGKNALALFLERHGVETRDLMPIVSQPLYRAGFSFPRSRFPVSWRLVERGLCLGCHPDLTPSQLDWVSTLIHRFFR